MQKSNQSATHSTHKKQNLSVQSHKTATFGDKSLKTLGP